MPLIDKLLTQHSDEDKVAILQTIREYGLHDDDPLITILIAIGALERLLKYHPGKIQAKMTNLDNLIEQTAEGLTNAIAQSSAEQQQLLAEFRALVQEAKTSAEEQAKAAVEEAIATHTDQISRSVHLAAKSTVAASQQRTIVIVAIAAISIFTLGLMLGSVGFNWRISDDQKTSPAQLVGHPVP